MLVCCKSHTHAANIKFYNQTHVLVASNNISLSYQEGRIYIIALLNPLPVLIILLNPLPVLIALKILRDILSFTRSFMINTRLLVGCLENSDRKVKQFRVIPWIASSRLVHSSSIQCPISECVWFCNVTPDLYREICHTTDIVLTEQLGSNGFYIIFSDKFGLYL